MRKLAVLMMMTMMTITSNAYACSGDKADNKEDKKEAQLKREAVKRDLFVGRL